MDIGPNNDMTASEIAANMCERIRGAHEAADPQQAESVGGAETDTAARSNVDEVGARLREKLEPIVEAVISSEIDASDDVIGKAIDVIVDERIERSPLPVDDDYRRQLAERMREDPVVVGELDAVMQSIARQMAMSQA